jgi:ABC transporter substrate binding protein
LLPGSTQARDHRELIIGLVARYRLPAVYFNRLFVDAGGLISYGPSTIDSFRGAAGYVDRILKGEKPGELPVQAPTKFELVINLKTAKTLGLTIPRSVRGNARWRRPGRLKFRCSVERKHGGRSGRNRGAGARIINDPNVGAGPSAEPGGDRR